MTPFEFDFNLEPEAFDFNGDVCEAGFDTGLKNDSSCGVCDAFSRFVSILATTAVELGLTKKSCSVFGAAFRFFVGGIVRSEVRGRA